MRTRSYLLVALGGLGAALVVGNPACSSPRRAPSLPHCDGNGGCPPNVYCDWAACVSGDGSAASCSCGPLPDWRGCCPDGLVVQYDALTGQPQLLVEGPPACAERCVPGPCSQCIDASAPFPITASAPQPCDPDGGETGAGACPSGTFCTDYPLQPHYCWPRPDPQGCCLGGLVVAPDDSVAGGYVCVTPAQLPFGGYPIGCSGHPCQRCLNGDAGTD